jgi:two-component system chemotaxis response regulator CheB
VTPRIRVLVVDDSAYSRQAITRMLRTSPLVEVVGVACDGEDALRKVRELEPELILTDLEMPKMDGFMFLRILMNERPTPVLVMGSQASDEDAFKALELGAVDVVGKPTPTSGPALEAIERELIRRVHAIRELRIDRVRDRVQAPPSLAWKHDAKPPAVVAIGASTGGPASLMQLFGAFAETPPTAFLLAQHMPEGFTRGFADRLDRLTTLRAREARGGERPAPGEILVAPGGRHLEIATEAGQPVARIALPSKSDKYSPSVDRLFSSAAKAYGRDLMAVVLTGMGDDGRRGVVDVDAAGGSVIAESEQSAVIFGMPGQAIRTGVVDRVLPLEEVASSIQSGLDTPARRRAPRAREGRA